MVRKLLTCLAVLGIAIALHTTSASAQQLSGAIFTTDGSGVPVNLNIYDAKEDVHLNGGPGINAPDDAAGLPAGTYYFQVTDPSGKDLLSSDDVECRQFTVDASGVIQGVVAAGGCEHATGADGEDGGATVQLFPYDDTTNNGGVYKVWVTPVDAYDCEGAGNKHCFVPADSKTDNFKVRAGAIVEIDTRFAGKDGYLLGMKATWFDTVGASNIKYSEYAPALLAFYEAHVEAAEQGLHHILVEDQPGCQVEYVQTPTGAILYPVEGSVTVPVRVKSHKAGEATYFVDVHCVHD